MSSDPPYSTDRLRRTTFAFFATKGLTAPLNLLIFLLISGWLPKADFALYVWLAAFGQVCEWVSYAGINWVAVHYIPLYRAQIGGRTYVQFVWRLIWIRYALVACVVAISFVAAPGVLALFGQRDWIGSLHVYLALMTADLAVKFLRLCVFEPLLEHGAAQRNVLLQHVVALALLFALSKGQALSIEQVLWARIAATAIAWGAAIAYLAMVVRPTAGGRPDHAEPQARTLVKFAIDNYTQDLVRILSDGPMVTLLGSRLVGLAALAQFGFAGSLTEFLSRVLPTTLFLGLVRPRLIADYGSDGAFVRLRGNVALLLKISMTLLAATAALVVAVGRPVLSLLSGGKYGESYGLLYLFLLWLALGCVRTVQAVLANVLGHSSALRRAAVSSLLVIPAAVALVYAGTGAYGLVLGMILGEALWVLLIGLQLQRLGHHLGMDAAGYLRILGAAAAGALTGRAAMLLLGTAWWPAGVAGAVTIGIFALAIRMLRPFDTRERSAIERVVGRRVVFL